MSMRGQLISKEYNRMTFVSDKSGKQYACYIKDLKGDPSKRELSDEERRKCLDTSLVAGDSW